jgi:hypothetical protein
VLRLVLTANVASSPILVTLVIEAIRSSETLVLKRATRRNITEDGIPRLIQCSQVPTIGLQSEPNKSIETQNLNSFFVIEGTRMGLPEIVLYA